MDKDIKPKQEKGKKDSIDNINDVKNSINNSMLDEKARKKRSLIVLIIAVVILGIVVAFSFDKIYNLTKKCDIAYFETYKNKIEKQVKDTFDGSIDKKEKSSKEDKLKKANAKANSNTKDEELNDESIELQKTSSAVKNSVLISLLEKEKVTGKVVKVVDGDTLIVEFPDIYKGTNEVANFKIRLVGVDTPESVHKDPAKNTKMGKVASNFTKENLLGKEVQVQIDVEPFDHFGRLLAFVYVDGKMYNEYLLEQGMARALNVSPNTTKKYEFKKLENQAKEAKKGIWNEK